MYTRLILISIISFFVASCNSIPKVLQGEFSSLSPQKAKQNQITMKKVRWSGQIIQVINDTDKTCFVVVGSETTKSLRPKRIIPKNGSRFIACKADFLEPKAFEDKLVTITGTISQFSTEKVGEYEYEYPVVSTDKIYIWSQNRPIYNNYSPILLVNPSPYFCHFNHRGLCL